MTSVEAEQTISRNEKLAELKRNIEQASIQIKDAEELKDSCWSQILQALDTGEALNPRDSETTRQQDDFFRSVYSLFHEKQFEDAAERLFFLIWQELQSIQFRSKETQVYGNDAVAAILIDTFIARGDQGAAMRWVIALEACQVLCYGALSQPVRGQLHGVPLDAMEELKSIALKNRDLVHKAKDWSLPEAFAEDVVTKFLVENQKYGALFARHTPRVNEFPLSEVYFGSLHKKVKTAECNADKGKTLEDLATYLALLIPGWIPRRNVKTVYNEFESDIIISNLIQAGNLNAELFGRNFLIECKNWSRAVGVQQVGYFLYRMRLTHTSFGILFASNGITGGNNDAEDQTEKTAATSLLRRAFSEDGNICIVLDSEDLDQLESGQSFWTMIVTKARTVQFGESTYKAYR